MAGLRLSYFFFSFNALLCQDVAKPTASFILCSPETARRSIPVSQFGGDSSHPKIETSFLEVQRWVLWLNQGKLCYVRREAELSQPKP